MKILVISFFHSQNLGDLVLSDQLHQFAARYGETERISYSGERFEYSDINHLQARSAMDSEPPKRRIAGSRYMRAAARSALGAAGILPRLDQRRLRKLPVHMRIVEAIRRSDIVLIGGGNMLFDVGDGSCSASEFGYFVKIARDLGKPVFAIALGIGPFRRKWQLRYAVEALAKCDARTFRDARSLALYNSRVGPSRGGALTIDPAFMVEASAESRISAGLAVGFNLMDYRLSGGSGAEYSAAIRRSASVITSLLKRGAKEVLIFSTDRLDREASVDLERSVADPRVRIVEIDGLQSLLQLYKRLDLVIGTRMHALIIAYTQGVPVIGFSWQAKVRAFFEIVQRTDLCFPLIAKARSVDDVIAKCEEVIRESSGGTRQGDYLGELRKRFEVNAAIMTSLGAKLI